MKGLILKHWRVNDVADTLMHLKDSNHIAVLHKGRYFKVYIRHKRRLLEPVEIEA